MSFVVPQGSVLSPIPFTLYTCPLGHICKKHNTLYHLYADDQQIYLGFHPGPSGMQLGQQSTLGPQASCLFRIERCISEIRKWMIHNKLRLNDDKTEFIIINNISPKQIFSSMKRLSGDRESNPGSLGYWPSAIPLDHRCPLLLDAL